MISGQAKNEKALTFLKGASPIYVSTCWAQKLVLPDADKSQRPGRYYHKVPPRVGYWSPVTIPEIRAPKITKRKCKKLEIFSSPGA